MEHVPYPAKGNINHHKTLICSMRIHIGFCQKKKKKDVLTREQNDLDQLPPRIYPLKPLTHMLDLCESIQSQDFFFKQRSGETTLVV